MLKSVRRRQITGRKRSLDSWARRNWPRLPRSIFPLSFAALLLFAVIPASVITALSFSSYSAEIEANSEQFVGLLLSNLRLQLQERLHSYEQLALDFYGDQEMVLNLEENLRALDQEGVTARQTAAYKQRRLVIEKRLYELSRSLKYIRNLCLFPADGQEQPYYMRDQRAELRGYRLADEEAFAQSQLLQRTRQNYGYPLWSWGESWPLVPAHQPRGTVSRAENFTLSVGIFAPASRRALGYLILSLEPRALSESLTSYSFYGTGNSFLVGPDSVLATLNPDFKAPNLSGKQDLLARIRHAPEGSFRAVSDQQELFVSLKHMEENELFLVHIVSLDSLLAPARTVRNRCFLAIALLFCASIGFARWFSASLSRPLHQILQAMDQFSQNDLHQRIQLGPYREFTRLGQGFNQMAERTESLVQQSIASAVEARELKLQRAQAELLALQMQIQPHFLYNSLDIIRWEVMREGGGQTVASRMLDQFSAFLRMSLADPQQQVPLTEELEHVRAYLQVLEIRKKRRPLLQIDVEEGTEGLLLPKFSLQPLVENALLHAFEAQTEAEPRLWIQASRQEGRILLEIRDNGRGLEAGKLARLGSGPEGRGLGLNNVLSRLQLCYGERFAYQFDLGPEGGLAIQLYFLKDKKGPTGA